ncbi:unnamed protein product [Eretmochelys imbricata]
MCYMTFFMHWSPGGHPSSAATVLDVFHEGHLGVKKIKELLHDYACWPGLYSDIEQCMKACSACTMHRITAPLAPLKLVVIDRRLQSIAENITGPSTALHDGYTLVFDCCRLLLTLPIFIHNFTRHLKEAHFLPKHFIRNVWGLPDSLVSDDGDTFCIKRV